MNIITIAFCLQYVIACWPKTDVIKNNNCVIKVLKSKLEALKNKNMIMKIMISKLKPMLNLKTRLH